MVELKDKLEEIRDEVEDEYIDPLKDKIDEVSEKPLAFMKKYGNYVVWGFIAAVVIGCILFAVL